MNKKLILRILMALVAVALFVGLVHIVLMVAQVSKPADSTVYGLTPRRLWAQTIIMLALAGVVIGGLALRSKGRLSISSGRLGAVSALVAGLIAVVSSILLLALANGGPGSGNGVVGSAGALVFGLVATVLGWIALIRSRRGSIQNTFKVTK